ncbi:single-stranded DNA-binding protein [Xanthomonas euvesicatoria pv. eucalypti]|uniref:single-stranded DNA-binding protein n=1 Tax=Lysobacteraceae TaxID=32033 RepID=UPI0009BCE834|nr:MULTISPECIES: single-stranded DNA-binding protein [Xanthomonadaceae]MCC8799084.1 single-stranded DNA-binding protein [Xanthomonas euvesicatoria pv. euvesicatoria]MCC8807689.1 single-stranded DNA-binding protein [Xanthomonas euvesicatoria pv. euvesicatoria]MCC8816134.1 single-stranded DNA-binding protein [Xanthomonas euvesicatoria pv. euvesicatoria]MDO7931539.1 single-stranded DNA-binding protein [Xanthomonas euvesicatoria pv. eucalypti]MDO7935734.1 single-stranded DNA-binding protein [Xanth
MPRKSECRVDCMGFVANDPQLRQANGTPVISLVVMENEYWKDSEGNRKERAHAHNVSFWGPYAETVDKLVQKGAYVRVKGNLRYRPIEGQQYDKTAEVRGDEFYLLDDPRERGESTN